MRLYRPENEDLCLADALSAEAQPQWEKLEGKTLDRMTKALQKVADLLISVILGSSCC